LKDEILFHGIVAETVVQVSAGVHLVKVFAISASDILDRECVSEMHQNVLSTYEQIVKEIVSKKSGQVICTVGDGAAVKAPLLCYKETIWQYLKRLASHFNQPVMADVKSGKAALWFGVRKGRSIDNYNLTLSQIDIDKLSEWGAIVSCSLRGGENYELGDYLSIDGRMRLICQKEVRLKHGEIEFLYRAADKPAASVKRYGRKEIAGLSLKGTVEKAENEKVYVRLDIDGKEGLYPFPWYPETGNVLYAMPEVGAKVELYFMSDNEAEAIAVRCRDTESVTEDKKMITGSNDNIMLINSSEIRLNCDDKLSICGKRIFLEGKRSFDISAKGKIKINSKTVEITAPQEVKCVTEK